ncbi:MAG TPA: SIMPL domain-containing protein [Candidatus Acidoferrales bacterium]|nr:SIMPL domain-containing protein [Candidatus Acidoferrales bacterium]
MRAKSRDQTIEVTGSAEKRIKSDLMIWQASVVAEAPALPDAYRKLTHDVDLTKKFLIAHGIPDNQIVINSVETTPIRPAQRQAQYASGDQQQSITGTVTGYHLKQSLSVRSTDIDGVTAVSREVTELINQGILLDSEAPEYLYTKLAQTKVEIMADAARDARERAQQIASSTSSRIGEIRSASMGVLQITAADSNTVSDYGVNDTTSLEKDVTAVVHATFAVD